MSPKTHTSKPAHRFAVVGGDGRMTYLAQYLAEIGYAVRVFGCGEECLPFAAGREDLRVCTTLSKAVEGATAVILPLPATRDGRTVHCPRDPACTISLKEVAALLARDPGLHLFGGGLPRALREETSVSPRITDYNLDEAFLQKNAEITAEAALMTAMALTDYALRGTPVAILGFGRIAKYLARLLSALGAEVTVCARRAESLAEAAAAGYATCLLSPGKEGNGLLSLCPAHRLVFNTVPAPVMPLDFLLALPAEALVMDLASAPFGVTDGDVGEATSAKALRYLRAPSLPGSYAPRDAGYAIGACILEALDSMQNGGVLL